MQVWSVSLYDGLDVERSDRRAAHDAEIHLFRLNEREHLACDHVLEIEDDVRALLTKASDRVRQGARRDRRGAPPTW